jgi:hypothetical protein
MNRDGHADAINFVADALAREANDLRNLFDQVAKRRWRARMAAEKAAAAAVPAEAPKGGPKLMLIERADA